MFGSTYPNPLNQGPGGPMNEAGPTTIRVTDPRIPPMGFASPLGPLTPSAPRMPPISSASSVAGAAPAPAPTPAGMFGAPAHSKRHEALMNVAQVLTMLALGATARNNPMAGAEMQALMQGMATKRKNAREDQQTQQYVQALVAQGMDPNQAVIMAADPTEMAKHIGTHFDTQRVDEGSSVYTPQLNGSSNIFTAPKTFKEGADITQMPGSQTVAPPFSMDAASGIPQQLGSPQAIPGLRTEAEQYADSIAQRGTPQWNSAVQDFALKGYGPAAQSMLGQRLQTQSSIAAGRDATSRTNNMRSTATSAANTQFRATHPAAARTAQMRPPTPSTVIGGIMDKQASGQPLTEGEQGALRDYRTHYKPQRGAVQISPNEPFGHSPDGRTIVLRGGHWVDTATGKPVQ